MHRLIQLGMHAFKHSTVICNGFSQNW